MPSTPLKWPLRRVLVEGPSMAPTLRHGDQVVVWFRRSRRLPRPGTVVVVDLPGRGLAVKRVRHVTADGAVWVYGDNPFGSTDSRTLGALDPAAVRGQVLARLWPRPGRVRGWTSPPGAAD